MFSRFHTIHERDGQTDGHRAIALAVLKIRVARHKRQKNKDSGLHVSIQANRHFTTADQS